MISILYVDDETTLLEITRVYLERTGNFSVATSTSAQEAIGMLSEGSYDAVVSDYQMPSMDGLAFLKHLRAQNNSVPFILFTGKGREEVAIEALNSGADFYLQKGGDPKSQYAELASKIRQAVQRNQAEQALAESEEKYRDLVENINDVLYVVGSDSRITYISPQVSQFGFTPDEVTGRPVSEFIMADDLPDVEERFRQIENGERRPFEFRILDGAKKIRVVRASSKPVFNDTGFAGIHGVMTDITSVKTAEAKISQSEQRYRNVFEAAGDAMLVVDGDSGDILDANRAATYIFGFTREELKCMKHAELRADAGLIGSEARTRIFGSHLQYYRNKEGSIFPADVLTSEYPQKKRTIAILSIRNITDEIHAEERVLAAQRLFAVLSQINQAIVRVRDLETLVDEICRISVEYGGFRMSWVGLLDRDTQTFRPVAHAGHEEGYLAAIAISVHDDKLGRGPTGTALREGQYNICNDIAADPRMEPWRDEALKRGYHSSAAFPFRLHGDVVGAYMIYAAEKNVFTGPEIALLEEIANDISFALDLLDEQARRTHAEKALAGSEERAAFLAEVLETSSQPFGIAYPGGAFGIVNPALCNLLGYTETELRSMTWTDIMHPDCREQEAAAIAELSKTDTPLRYERVYIRKDGSRVPVETFVHRVIDDGGDILFYYMFVTDISERTRMQDLVKSERDRAQQYLDTTGVMLAAVDPSGTITLINKKGSEILGYSEKELIGRNWLDTCLPANTRNEVKQVFDTVVSGDIEPVEYHENAILTKSGDVRILAFHNTLIKGKDSAITGILFSGEDITQRKQMEKELSESEVRFRSLIQNSSDMIQIIGRDGLIAYSSPSTLRITGYDPADLLGKDPLDYVHPDDRLCVKETIGEVFRKTNPNIPTEYRIRHADGHFIDVDCIATNLLDVPIIDGIVTTTRLITERKMAEQALKESEGRYQAIFEKSADAIFVMSDRFLDCNPAAEHLFGYPRDEIIGQGPAVLSPAEQPGGGISGDLAAEYIQAAKKGTPQVFPWTHKTKDGRLFSSEVTLIPAQVRGEERVIAIIHDRTAQDTREQQSRHLARFPEQNPEPVIEIDPDRNITYANPACCTVLKTLGMPPHPAAFIPEDFDTLAPALKTAGGSAVHREVQIGTAFFSEMLSYDPVDQRIRIFARDITTLAFETSALEQANRKLNLLASITRHDIKNKLTGVMGYLELAKGSTRDPDLIEYLSRAEISATAIRLQIEFTKEYEKLGVKPPVWHEISQVSERAQKLLGKSAVAVEDETAGLSVYADPMLEKVLFCLFENALKHGDTTTKIHIHGSPAPAGYLLVVEDDGVGIPEDRKEKIFNKNVGKGSGGFGLFLAREILSITGITIEETGGQGSGARFEISVPVGKFHVKSLE